MKKGTKKVKKSAQLIDELSEIAAKKYAEERGVLLKERYKHHKTTAFWAYKQGIEYALNTPELLQHVSDDVLKKAGLMRVVSLEDSSRLQCVMCAGTGRIIMISGLHGQSTTKSSHDCHNCSGTGYIILDTASTNTYKKS